MGRLASTEGTRGGRAAGKASLRALPAPLRRARWLCFGSPTSHSLTAKTLKEPPSTLLLLQRRSTEHRKTMLKHVYSTLVLRQGWLTYVEVQPENSCLAPTKPPLLEARRACVRWYFPVYKSNKQIFKHNGRSPLYLEIWFQLQPEPSAAKIN